MKAKTMHAGANEERHEILRKLVRERDKAYKYGENYCGVVLDGIIGFVKERIMRTRAKKGGL